MPRFDADYVPRSAMAIFAHPDDADFTVSGTIAKWAAAGCEVTYLLLTSGNTGTHDPRFTRESLAAAREAEEQAAARILGVKNLVFLRRDDCELVPTLDLRREVVRVIRRFRPEVVVCGDPQAWFYGDTYINHPDHRAAAQIALEATFPCAEMELLWPEEGPPHKVHAVYVGTPREPTAWIDITGTIEAKIAALKAHESQMGEWDPEGRIRQWAGDEAKNARRHAGRGRRRGAGGAESRPGAPRYAEAFRIMKIVDEEQPPES
jgi:LmbE family N-acetylglucosaminyl deacetylase